MLYHCANFLYIKYGLLISFFLFSIHRSYSAESDVLYELDREDIRSMNAMTLADVIQKLPFITQHYFHGDYKTYNGAHSIQVNAIFRDDLPLFMDQNFPVDLQLVSLNNISKIVLKAPSDNSFSKHIGSVNIYLYSFDIAAQPYSVDASTSLNTDRDFQTTIFAGLSNKLHSLGVGLAYVSGKGNREDHSDRAFDWASFSRYDMAMNYKFQLPSRASFDLAYNGGYLDRIQQNSIYSQTARASDINWKAINHRLNARIKSRLSKSHYLDMAAQYSLNDNYHYTTEVDLGEGRWEIDPVNTAVDSLRHEQMLIRTEFKEENTTKKYSYGLGIEFCNLKDLNYKSIQAIKVGYTDYVLFGNVNYSPAEEVGLQLGIKYLSNPVFGNLLLPRVRVALRLNNNLETSVQHYQSAVYPLTSQVFYTPDITHDPILNNLQLQATAMRVTHIQAHYKLEKVDVKSGMLFSTMNNAIELNYSREIWSNSGLSRDISTYLNFRYHNQKWTINPVLLAQSINSIADTLSQFNFLAQFAYRAAYYSPKLKLSFMLYGKSTGNSRKSLKTEAGLMQTERPAFHILDMALNKLLLKEQLSIRIGVNNVFNVYSLINTNYKLRQFDRQSAPDSEIMVGAGRSYFIRLSVDIK